MKMLSNYILLTLIICTSSAQATGLNRSNAPDNATVYIISPANGAIVDETITVQFGLNGMGVSPAGLDKKNTGHHHLLIDSTQLPATDKPMGKEVMHFGGGQTEKTITLSKGKHTLQLVLGNYLHIPHNPPVVSEVITVNVR